MPTLRALACLLACCTALAATAAENPAPAAPAIPSIADFARTAEFSNVELSPSGEFVAAMVTKDDQTSLVIFETATRKVVSGLKLAFGDSVFKYWWSGPAEVVAELGSNDGPLGEAVRSGDIMVLDAVPGTTARYLVGQHGSEGPIASRVKVTADTYIAGFADMVDATPDNPRSILVSIHYFGASVAQISEGGLFEIDTKSARRTRVATAPQEDCRYVTDSHGALRFAVCDAFAKDSNLALYRFIGGDAGWETMPTSGATQLVPWFVSRDDRWAYFSAVGLKGSPSDADCLARQPLDGSAPLAIVSCQAGSDVLGVFSSADGREALAAYYEPDLPQLDFLESKHPDGELLLALQQAFGGQLALPASSSRDGTFWLLKVESDHKPGSYYLYNRKTKEASKLFDQYPKLARSPMQPVKAVQFKSRDGVLVHGYLTLPKANGSTKPPLVVVPHGGPFGIRDSWGFDPETQLLASRGYAVLRVNFRGSGGYGDSFTNSAQRKWGTVMIDDITDAVRYVIGQNLVDAERVAIFGGSYGGYAALMSAVREPALYKAAVSYAGVSDLVSWADDTDASEWASGRKFIEKYVGKDTAELRQQSPLTYINQLKAPVMIIHGEADQRVPFNQAKRLRSALEKKNHPYVWLTKYDEGHGFYHHANRVELYEKMLAFLDKNLGMVRE